MAIHSSTIAWKIPWTEAPGGLQSMGWQRVGHDWATSCSHSSTLYLYLVPTLRSYLHIVDTACNFKPVSSSSRPYTNSAFPTTYPQWLPIKCPKALSKTTSKYSSLPDWLYYVFLAGSLRALFETCFLLHIQLTVLVYNSWTMLLTQTMQQLPNYLVRTT